MESRFNKYKSEGKAVSDHIANINSFINYLNKEGNDLIEEEIKDLTRRIEEGDNNQMFPKKKKLLITLGETIEDLYATYHFNRGDA